MEKITSLIKQLRENSDSAHSLTHLKFEKGDHFEWNHNTTTITYNPDDEHAAAYLLHEFSHAALNHSAYDRDVELLSIEREAWTLASTLAGRYSETIDDDVIEDSLDTYRNWMHARSLCPGCNATGMQIGPQQYECLACHTKWKVNEARTCALRRYGTNKNSAK